MQDRGYVLPRTHLPRGWVNRASWDATDFAGWQHSGVGTGPRDYERRSGDGRAAGPQPRGDGRAAGTPLPYRPLFPPHPRRGIQRASPRRLRDGDAPVRGALQRQGEHAGVPGSPPRCRLSRCAECWSGRDCGLSRGSSTMAIVGYWTSWSLASLRMGRCGETVGTSPSRSRHRSGGLSGSSGWNPKARQAQPTVREHTFFYAIGGTEQVSSHSHPRKVFACIAVPQR
jgi:hypothetical protein